jgi:hypothetical protein
MAEITSFITGIFDLIYVVAFAVITLQGKPYLRMKLSDKIPKI